MKTRRISLFLLATGLLATGVLAESAAPTASSPPAAVAVEVSGRVVDPSGRPLSGARAELAPLPSNHAWAAGLLAGRLAPAAVAAAETGPDGRFLLAVPETGVWSLTVTAAGRVAMRLAPLAVVEDEVLPDVALWPAGPARVRVLDAAGAPAAGVWVHAASLGAPPWDGAEAWRPAVRAAATGTDGTAVLARAAGERLEVHALPPASLAAVVARGDDRLELRLPPPEPHRTIRIVDAGGRALSGVVVSRDTLAWPSGLTGEDGTLRLSAAGGGRGLFLFGPAGERLRTVLPDPAPPAATDGAPEAVALVLPDPGTVGGRVVAAPARRPLAGALVAPLYDPGRFVVTAAEGAFALPAAAAPVSDLVVRAAGHLPRRVRPATGDRPVVGLQPAVAVHGVVRDGEGAPLPGASLRAAAPAAPGETARVLARTVSGDGGRFVLPGLPPGQALEITASRDGHLSASLRTAAPAAGAAAAPVHLVLRPGRAAAGRVVDTAERPVAGAEVEVRPSAPAAAGTAGPVAAAVRTVSDGAGRFELPGLPAPRVDLEARAPGFAPLVVRGIEVPAADSGATGSGAVDLGTLVLEPGAVLPGRVTAAGGAPLPGAEVRMVLDDGTPPRIAAAALAADPPRAVTDREGRFRLGDLPSGRRAHLLVSAAGHLPAELPGVPVPPGAPVVVELQPAAGLAGRIEEPGGQPVAGAAVLLRTADPRRGTSGAWQPRPEAKAVSDGDGRFRFAGVAAGSAVLDVAAAGYVAPEPVPVEIPAGATAEPAGEVVVVLEPGARVEGTVRDEDGEPVAEVPVRIARVRDTTDAEGRFRLDGVEPGRRMLVAAHLEYERLVREVEVEPAGSRFDLVLTGGWPVSGRVVDEDGTPVRGAEVRLTADPAGGEMRLYRAASDGEGGFRFPRVVDGRYALAAAAVGYAPHRRAEGPRVRGAAVEDLEVVLTPGTEVEGRLLGLDFDALAAAVVAAEGDAGERIGTVDHEGRFRVTDLGPGVWRLRARAPGGRQAEARLAVEPGVRRLHRDLRFEGFVLAGRVTHGGEPVTGASVSAAGRDTGTERSATTDWEGRFVLENLPPGRYLLSVASPRDGLLDNRELELAEDRDVAVEIAARRLAGRVVSSTDGRPVRNALVRLQRELGADGQAGSLITVATDRTGGFAVQRVSAGSYLLAVEADGYVPDERRLEIAAAAEAVEVVLDPADTLEVVLGGAAAGAEVVRLAVLGAGGAVLSRGAYPVEADGRVRLRRLPPGAWHLLVSTPASAVALVAAQVPGPPVELAPPPSGHLDVRVPALLETNTTGELTLAAPDGSLWLGQEPSGAPRDRWPLPGGAGRVDNLPPGAWVLRVTAPDGRTWEQPVALPPGGRQVVTLP